MNVEQLKFDPGEAAKLMRKYREHKAWQTPVDAEIERVATLITKGKVIIRGSGSVVLAGLNGKNRLPKLAIARADAPFCRLDPVGMNRTRMLSGIEWLKSGHSPTRVFDFPAGSFPDMDRRMSRKAMAPHMPPDIRPHRGLENYTLLWEAEWSPVPPIDPILARRVGKSDFFLVLAQWDLSPIERFVLQSRIGLR